jgi:hypothetical protein
MSRARDLANLGDGITGADLPAGSVLQVVSVNLASGFSTTSTSFVDVTGFTASITPSSTSSKVLILVSSRVSASSGSNINNRGNIQLMKGALVLSQVMVGAFLGGVSGSDLNQYHAYHISYLDSPSSTSSTTYKIQLQSEDAANTMTCAEPSAITLMEIAG